MKGEKIGAFLVFQDGNNIIIFYNVVWLYHTKIKIKEQIKQEPLTGPLCIGFAGIPILYFA